MKKKIIILTAAIIRGNYHKNSIGKFYEEYNDFLLKYDVYHIINIDEPNNLKKYFTIYETVNLFNKIIPNNINKEYIKNNEKPGFLRAFKNLMNKIDELDLFSEDNLYWWYEDDWVNNKKINFFEIFDLFSKNKNNAMILTENSSLGSFRAGPLMSGSYFKNFFNIEKKKLMNDTCDPEKQVKRWLSGNDKKNGNYKIHRKINYNNNKIQIILFIYNNEKFDSKYFNHWNYPGDYFNKKINFEYHIIKLNDKKYYYGLYDLKNNNYKLKKYNMNKILNKFDNNYIKYFHFVPFIFSDIGRDFNQKYSLKKWLNIEDNTSYKDIKLANAFLGNWKNFKIDDIRLNTKYTMNNKFNFCFILIIQILPYIYQKYFKIGIKVNFNYFSHSYGNYPNFNIIGKFIKLNYRPNEIPNNFEHSELFDLCKIYHDYCGKQLDTDESFKFYSFQKDFKLAKKYMELFFKFDEKIINKKNKYINSMKNKKNLGIYYGGTNKLNPINFDTFLSYVDNELLKNKYDNIVISTDKIEYQEKFIAYYADFSIIILNKNLKDYENKGINSERLKIISNIVKNLKNSETFDEKMFYELELKRQSAINTIYLQNYIIENFLLSECDFVIKDNPDELSLCKIINPELNINLIRKYKNIPWPDSYIDLYSKYKSNKKINLVSLE